MPSCSARTRPRWRVAATQPVSLRRPPGAPKDAIQILAEPTLEATNALMRADETDLVIATGGGPMVRAAYSSGNPALGVGPGNTPVYVDRTADLALAAEKIVEGKEYDYGTPCSAPSVVLADQPVARDLRGLLERNGAYFCSGEELVTLEAAAFPGGRLNPAIVGQPAGRVAQIAGLLLPPETRAIVGLLHDAESVLPMAREKLSVLLGAAVVDGVEGAIGIARWMLRSAGAGHTAAIFTGEPEQAVLFGAALDYYRIVVNGDPTNGAVGQGTGLPVTFTIGTGFAGKSSIDHNLGPEVLALRIVDRIDPYHSFLVNRNKQGSMLLPGDTLFILEMTPSANALLAANEAEKAADVKLVDCRFMGAAGRLYMAGTASDVRTAAEAAKAALGAALGTGRA